MSQSYSFINFIYDRQSELRSLFSDSLADISNIHKVVVLTGAGISKESGLPTFRDNDGLWRKHRFEDVASVEAWERDPQLVLDFYNERRRAGSQCKPNGAHNALTGLEKRFQVNIVTQNVDNYHEQAGSSNILHLHGEIDTVRSVSNPSEVIPWTGDLSLTDRHPDSGDQLRPNVVWFGEDVPNITIAEELVADCDLLLVIGTSLSVYPAAGLIHDLKPSAKIQVVDPGFTDKQVLDDSRELIKAPLPFWEYTTAEIVSALVDTLTQ